MKTWVRMLGLVMAMVSVALIFWGINIPAEEYHTAGTIAGALGLIGLMAGILIVQGEN